MTTPLTEVYDDDTAIHFIVRRVRGAAALKRQLEPRLLGLLLFLLLFPLSDLFDDERR